MKRTGWNSPQSARNRIVRSITRQATHYEYSMPKDTIDTTYMKGELIENAEHLLKDAVNASVTRDLVEYTKVQRSIALGDGSAYHTTANKRDFGVGDSESYELPKDWSLPINDELWDQRDRLSKAAALILMELERLERLNNDSRNLGYSVFDPVAREEKSKADKELAKQMNKQHKRELDICKEMTDSSLPTSNSGLSNVTASTQSQFTGTVQPMPQAVPC